MQRIPMYMQDWINKLHAFLKINDKKLLEDAGKISHELAKEIAEREYDSYYKKRLLKKSRADLDFENLINQSTKILKIIKKQ